MRRIVLLIVAIVASCDSSSGDVCEEPTEVLRPVLHAGQYQGDESHCRLATICMENFDCADDECAITCMENTFGAADCGCCGDECEDTCSQILDLASALSECGRPGADGPTDDDCFTMAAECNQVNFPGRESVDD